jgi:hypothetical protein
VFKLKTSKQIGFTIPPKAMAPIYTHTSPLLTRYRQWTDDRHMCRRMLAALVILGWVSLSVFDVAEDLDEVPGQAAVSSSSPDDGFSKRGGWGPLANNIVESAIRTDPATVTLITFSPSVFYLKPVHIFRRQFQLHKLYRVFLI